MIGRLGWVGLGWGGGGSGLIGEDVCLIFFCFTDGLVIQYNVYIFHFCQVAIKSQTDAAV